MFKGLIDTIIGNLQLSISNVHIRYEVGQQVTAALIGENQYIAIADLLGMAHGTGNVDMEEVPSLGWQ